MIVENYKPTKKWLKMGKVYKFFAQDFINADFSEDAKSEMFMAETYGDQYNFKYYDLRNGKINGYALGKHLMDIQLAMWDEDLRHFGQLTKYELMNDDNLKPIHEFLIEWFGWTQNDVEYFYKLKKYLTDNKLNCNIQIPDSVYKYIQI